MALCYFHILDSELRLYTTVVRNFVDWGHRILRYREDRLTGSIEELVTVAFKGVARQRDSRNC